MAPIQPPDPGGDFGQYDEESDGAGGRSRRRALVRYSVPVALAGVAAATIGLGTALAATGGSPSLPHLTAEQLLVRMAQSRTQTVSGTVQVTTDLGIPAGVLGGSGLPGGGAAALSGAAGQGGRTGGGSADPQTKLTELLSGTHTLRVAADGPSRQRISVLDSTSEYSVIHNGDQLWAYDSATNSVFHESRPAGAHRPGGADRGARPDRSFPATPQAAVQQALTAVDPTTSVTVDGTAEVAGRSAYQLVISPKQAGSTIGSIRVAVDAGNGVPLSFVLTPKGSGTPAVDIAYTSVDFGTPAASTFSFAVPRGAKVTEGGAGAAPGGSGQAGRTAVTAIGTGWTKVAELKPAAGSHGGPLGGAAGAVPGAAAGGAGLPSLLGSIGHRVHGAFGSATVIDTRLVNVLITSNGTVYAGAVTEGDLVKAADGAVGK